MNDVHLTVGKHHLTEKLPAKRAAPEFECQSVPVHGGRRPRLTEALEPEDAVPAVVDSPMELIDAPLELPAAAAEANKVGWNWTMNHPF